MKMHLKHYCKYLAVLLLTQILVSVTAYAQQTDSAAINDSIKASLTLNNKVVQSSRKAQSQAFLFQEGLVSNPALRFPIISFNNTQFGLKGYKNNDDDYIVEQRGRNDKGFAFSGKSLQKMGEQVRAWATANYNNGSRKVFRGLTSDFELIYPYYTGDTLREKKLNTETYALSGGYAQDQGRYIWGIEASMRTMQEYGINDPRTRNRVMDFDLSLGLAWKLKKSYLLGLGVYGGAYKQSQSVSFLSSERLREPLVSAIFNFTGLGAASSGTQLSWSYEMDNIGSDLNLYPAAGKGIIAALRYDYARLRKRVPEASTRPDQAIMGMDTYGLRLGWMDMTGEQIWAVTGSYQRRNRVGEETLVGRDFSLPTVPAVTMGRIAVYGENIDAAAFNLLYENKGRWSWSVLPQVAYHKQSMRYLHPQRSLTGERLQYGLEGRLHRLLGRHYLLVQFKAIYDQHLSSAIDLSNRLSVAINGSPIPGYDSPSMDTEYRNYRFTSTDNKQLEASLRWEFQAFPGKSLFIQPAMRKGWYTQNIGNNFYQLRVGLVL